MRKLGRQARAENDPPDMEEGIKQKILLLATQRKDRRVLLDNLSKSFDLMSSQPDNPLENDFDLAIVDGRTLKRLHRQIRERKEQQEPVLLPFLLVTSRRKGSRPLRHLGRLVEDVIARPVDVSELDARIKNLLRLRRLSVQLKKEHDRVVRLSVTDDVSGFHNTRYLHRYLDRFLAKPTAASEQLTLVFFDLDNFKEVVDTHGHLLGSKALREVAQCVGRVLDPDDRLVRYGGDEYVILLPRQTKDRALRKVDRLREAIATTPFLTKEGLDVWLTASFGLATFPEDARDKRELLAEADACLFCSKNAGKNRVRAPGAEVPPVETMDSALA